MFFTLLLGGFFGGISSPDIALLPAGSVDFTAPPSLSLAQQIHSKPLADGVHFYGQSAQAGVIGQEYFIFQVQGDRLKGALFMPQSEFHCTTGTLSGQQLALLVEDPYGEEPPSPLAIALVPRSPLTRADQTLELTLAGYQAIADIGEQEKAILEACLQS